MNIQHACKFCSAPVTLELGEEMLEFFNLDYWKSLSACNRCADYREKKRGLIDRIVDRSVVWLRHQNHQLRLNETEAEELRKSIVGATQKYADLICKFYRHHFSWEPDFAQQIMDNPVNTMRILSFFEGSISRKRTQ